MHRDLSDEENLALAALLKRTIDEDRYRCQPCILTLHGILAKLAPQPTREPRRRRFIRRKPS
jgi:hypothetical protein